MTRITYLSIVIKRTMINEKDDVDYNAEVYILCNTEHYSLNYQILCGGESKVYSFC